MAHGGAALGMLQSSGIIGERFLEVQGWMRMQQGFGSCFIEEGDGRAVAAAKTCTVAGLNA